MRACALVLLTACLLLVAASSAAPAVVKLSIVIPEGHKVTDVNLRFENSKTKTGGGSFEGGGVEGDDDADEEGPSFGPGGKAAAVGGRHSMVETFPVMGKKARESHNTINKVIKLPGQNIATIRK